MISDDVVIQGSFELLKIVMSIIFFNLLEYKHSKTNKNCENYCILELTEQGHFEKCCYFSKTGKHLIPINLPTTIWALIVFSVFSKF